MIHYSDEKLVHALKRNIRMMEEESRNMTGVKAEIAGLRLARAKRAFTRELERLNKVECK